MRSRVSARFASRASSPPCDRRGGREHLRRGGTVRWLDRELALRPASPLRERYALRAGDLELAVLDAKSCGRKPVTILIDDDEKIDPGLILFAAFVVRGLAEDAATSAPSGSGAATGG